ncbi:MAG: hypothetical protein JXQ29_09465 [Planctomycetes bacterium]|nr:hypothetical protein [Planctomycetota bacterium]
MRVRALVWLAAAAWAGAGTAAVLAAQAPTPEELHFRLGKAEILVRQTEDRRYVVESYLDYHPPAAAHPAFEPESVFVWFFGDATGQRLQVITSRINGRDVLRLVSPDDRGTLVGLHITPENRTAPLAVHLTVVLNAVRGRVALPMSEREECAEVTVVKPDGSRWRPEALVPSLVVDPKQASGLGRPVLAVAMIACFLAAIACTIVILRRK